MTQRCRETIVRPIRIVVSTQKSFEEFPQESLLGQSLTLAQAHEVGLLRVTVDSRNSGSARRGLGEVYNRYLDSADPEEILLFVHDDVFVHDWYLARRLNDAMADFDVVGVVGNTNPDFREARADDKDAYPSGWQPEEFLSGSIGTMESEGTKVAWFGDSPQECQLLDGVFLAVNVDSLRQASVRFDEQFEFHFYDLDFCRQCIRAGLRIGTWPIAIAHKSPGRRDANWYASKEKYFRKWGFE